MCMCVSMGMCCRCASSAREDITVRGLGAPAWHDTARQACQVVVACGGVVLGWGLRLSQRVRAKKCGPEVPKCTLRIIVPTFHLPHCRACGILRFEARVLFFFVCPLASPRAVFTMQTSVTPADCHAGKSRRQRRHARRRRRGYSDEHSQCPAAPVVAPADLPVLGGPRRVESTVAGSDAWLARLPPHVLARVKKRAATRGLTYSRRGGARDEPPVRSSAWAGRRTHAPPISQPLPSTASGMPAHQGGGAKVRWKRRNAGRGGSRARMDPFTGVPTAPQGAGGAGPQMPPGPPPPPGAGWV